MGPDLEPVLKPAPDRGLDPALRRGAYANGLAGLALTLALGLGLVAGLGLGAAYILKALAAYGLVLLILWRFLPLHWPRSRLGPANQVTLGRGVLTALVIALSGEAAGIAAGIEAGIDAGIGMGTGVGKGVGTCVGTCIGTGVGIGLGTGVATGAALAWTALTLALLATLLDGVDGHLARRLGWASPMGARFDMEVDALLVAGLALLLWTLDRAGPWVLAAGALRYLFVAAGVFWPWLARPLLPSKRRQTVCVIQILTLILALVPLLPRTWASLVAAIGLGCLVWSFALDIGWLAGRRGEDAHLRRGGDARLQRGGDAQLKGREGASALRRAEGSVPGSTPALARRFAGLIALVAALGLLNAALSFQGRWPTLGVEWRWEVSPEIAALILILGLTAGGRWHPSRRRLGVLAGVLTLLVLVRYFAVMAPALYGRPVNLAAEARFLPDILAMTLTSVPWPLLLALPLALLLLCGLIFLALRWSLGRVADALATGMARRWLTLTAGAAFTAWLVVVAGLASPGLSGVPGFSRPVVLEIADQVRLALSGLVGGAPMVVRDGVGNWAGVAASSELGGVRGAQVVILFAESYGAVTLDQPSMVEALAPSRAELAAALAATGRTAVSARVRSPTFAGLSKLAHASFLTGVEVSDHTAYDQLLAAGADTLVHRFARAGYRTLAVMPALRYGDWPEAPFYGFDRVLDSQALDYQGPDFGWWRIPDQFTLARLDAELHVQDDRPCLVVLGTLSSHAPFHPPPPYQPDWDRVLTAEPFASFWPEARAGPLAGQADDSPALGRHQVGEPAGLATWPSQGPRPYANWHESASHIPENERLFRDFHANLAPPGASQGSPEQVGTEPREAVGFNLEGLGDALVSDPGSAYTRTLDYLLRVVAGWLRLRPDLDLVLLIIGDHQPLAAVSGEGASWEVPVHLISSRPALNRALLDQGFVPGLMPLGPALGGMPHLARAFWRALAAGADP